MINPKYVRVLIVVVLVIFVGGLAFWLTNKSHVSITAPEGAEILVSENPDEEPESIGTGSAKYSTRKTGDLFIIVKKDGQQTQTSAQLEHRKTKDVNVTLIAQANRQKVADEGLSHIYFGQEFIYGINPNTRSISYFPTGVNQIPDQNYSLLPYASKVIWTDPTNFTFNTYGEGVKQVVGGNLFEDIDEGEGLGLSEFFDFDQAPNKPLVLLNETGVYLSDGFSIPGTTEITNLSSPSGTLAVFADQDQIYLANQTFEEVEEESDKPNPVESKVSIFGYDGSEKGNIVLPKPQEVNKVELVNNKTYVVLAEDQLYFMDKDTRDIQSAPYYFANSKDFIVVNNQLLVLNSRGLWKFDTDKKAYYLVSEFQEDEEYVAGSLTTMDDGVYFSSKSSRESLISGDQSKSAIYRVNAQAIAR
jgi:hypothetical protein